MILAEVRQSLRGSSCPVRGVGEHVHVDWMTRWYRSGSGLAKERVGAGENWSKANRRTSNHEMWQYCSKSRRFSWVSWEEESEGLCFFIWRPLWAELRCRAGVSASLWGGWYVRVALGGGVNFIKGTWKNSKGLKMGDGKILLGDTLRRRCSGPGSVNPWCCQPRLILGNEETFLLWLWTTRFLSGAFLMQAFSVHVLPLEQQHEELIWKPWAVQDQAT